MRDTTARPKDGGISDIRIMRASPGPWAATAYVWPDGKHDGIMFLCSELDNANYRRRARKEEVVCGFSHVKYWSYLWEKMPDDFFSKLLSTITHETLHCSLDKLVGSGASSCLDNQGVLAMVGGEEEDEKEVASIGSS